MDFVVARDGAPWFLAEVKHRETTLSPALAHYQQQIGAPFAFQGLDADYVDADCFAAPGPPLVVPARTLVQRSETTESQLRALGVPAPAWTSAHLTCAVWRREADFSAHRGYGSVAATASAIARVRRAAAITGRSMSLPSTSRTPPDCCS